MSHFTASLLLVIILLIKLKLQGKIILSLKLLKIYHCNIENSIKLRTIKIII